MRRPDAWGRALILGALLVGLAVVRPAGLRAATDTVGTCDESTLRSVIGGAAAGDTVTFGCSGTITLTSGGGGAITLSKDLTIDGSGQAVTISGGGSVQVLVVDSGVSVTLNDLTIANGSCTACAGAGILNTGTLHVTNSAVSGNSAGGSGGGILSEGALTVTNSTFHRNSAGGSGGGIWGAVMTVTDSSFSGNSALHGGGIATFRFSTVADSTFSGNGASEGGGVFNDLGTLYVLNSTFAGNLASEGGGIENFDNGTLHVTDSTLSSNFAHGGGIDSNGLATLRNTILAGSSCLALPPITNNGGNLTDDGSCGVTQVPTASLKLGTLASNGGPTQTIALLPGSVAIDVTTCLESTDQRGFPRARRARDQVRQRGVRVPGPHGPDPLPDHPDHQLQSLQRADV
jgi:predicted outer membrane repeat protein